MNPVLISLYSISFLLGVFAVVTKRFRFSVFSIWLSGMVLGFSFLVLGGEWLALLQWLISCSVGILFLVFGTVTGESEPKMEAKDKKTRSITTLATIGTLLFGVILTIGLMGLMDWGGEISPQETPAAQIGVALVRTHPITVFILGFLAIISIIGIGAMTRADWKRGDFEQ